MSVSMSSTSSPPPKVLVIAGSDSSGGAGLEADQRVLTAHGVYSMTATTALTAQNTTGVEDVLVTPTGFVEKMLKAVFEDVGVSDEGHRGIDGVKIGMLAAVDTIKVVADALRKYQVKTVVLDPVMVATSGAQLLPEIAVKTLREMLLPMATVLTPNIPEATLLLKDAGIQCDELRNVEDMKALAKRLHALGPKAVLLKGGHKPLTANYQAASKDSEKNLTVDILFDGHECTVIESKYLTSKNTHGTGCSLASAIAANLTHGQALPLAVRNACRYVSVGISTSFDLGHGSGPINHFHNIQRLPFAEGYFIEYLLDRPDVRSVWHRYTHHEFANQMANGTLPIDLFKNYLVQDYLYLMHFARTNGLAAYKSKKISDITASAQIVLHIQEEMKLHLEYCREFGLEKEEIEKQSESQACVAYSRYVLDIGQSEDWLALQIALAPCLLGYGMTAKRLHKEAGSVRDGNIYWKWIENYISDDYQQAVTKGSAMIEQHIFKQSPSRIEELVEIFIRATEMEVQFWDFGAHSKQ